MGPPGRDLPCGDGGHPGQACGGGGQVGGGHQLVLQPSQRVPHGQPTVLRRHGQVAPAGAHHEALHFSGVTSTVLTLAKWDTSQGYHAIVSAEGGGQHKRVPYAGDLVRPAGLQVAQVVDEVAGLDQKSRDHACLF